MNDFVDELFEEAIMALRLAGAMIPKYSISENGVVYFDYGQQETSNPPVHCEEPRGNVS